MTQNERCAKCLGWVVVVSNNGYSTYYWPDGKVVLDPPQNLTTMMVHRFHPDTDRNHSQIMVKAVREAGKVERFIRTLAPKVEQLNDDCFEWVQDAMIGFDATPAQISKAACEVLETCKPKTKGQSR